MKDAYKNRSYNKKGADVSAHRYSLMLVLHKSSPLENYSDWHSVDNQKRERLPKTLAKIEVLGERMKITCYCLFDY